MKNQNYKSDHAHLKLEPILETSADLNNRYELPCPSDRSLHPQLPANWSLVEHHVIHSTNLWAMDNLSKLTDRTLVTAASQTAGRGRLDRSWFSPPGMNLYISAVLKPPVNGEWTGGLSSGANLGQIMALALVDALTELEVDAQVKWPNDVLISGKKTAGILSEAGFRDGRFDGVVVGVGVNVNMGSDILAGQPFVATSLTIEKPGTKFDLSVVRNLIITHFEEMYAQFCQSGFGPWWSRWIAASGMIGRRVRVHVPGGDMVEGRVENLAATGELLLRDATRHGGDVGGERALGAGADAGTVAGVVAGGGAEILVIRAGDVELLP